jgi:hypothetical protein
MSAAAPLEDGDVHGLELHSARHGALASDLRLDEPTRERRHESEAIHLSIEDMPDATEPDRQHGAEHRDVGIHVGDGKDGCDNGATSAAYEPINESACLQD